MDLLTQVFVITGIWVALVIVGLFARSIWKLKAQGSDARLEEIVSRIASLEGEVRRLRSLSEVVPQGRIEGGEG